MKTKTDRWLKRLLGGFFFTFTISFLSFPAFALNFTADSLLGNTYSFSQGDRSASATFSFSGNTLSLTLTNTYGGDVADPIHVLQAVFFDLSGNPNLTPVSGVLPSGSSVLYGPDGGGNVGGEYGYRSDITGLVGGASQGISGAGYGIFGPTDVFPGGNLAGPVDPDGPGYGLLSAGYSAGGNSAVTGQFPMIKNSVVFALSGVSGLSLSSVSNVSFEYGTDVDRARVPEPASLLMMGLGMFGYGVWKKKFRKIS